MVEKIKEFSIFEILPFDELAAIEVALITRSALDAGDKKDGSVEVWSKIKYDRQIVAISLVGQAMEIYTDDAGLRNAAIRAGLSVVRVADLPLPPETAQGQLPLEEQGKSTDQSSLDEIEEARDAEDSPG